MNVFQAAKAVPCQSVAQYFNVPARKAGNKLVMLCPFHAEASPSFYLYPGSRGFYCFGCGKHGDSIDLWCVLSGKTALDSAKQMCEVYDISYDKRRKDPTLRARPKMDGEARALVRMTRVWQGYRLQVLKEEMEVIGKNLDYMAECAEKFGLNFALYLAEKEAWCDAAKHYAQLQDEYSRIENLTVGELLDELRRMGTDV